MSLRDYYAFLFDHDPATFWHCIRVGVNCSWLAKAVGLSKEQSADLILAGLSHDIGKSFVRLEVLTSEQALNEEEWAEIKKHPLTGALIVEGFLGPTVAQLVLTHHEPGYPRKSNRGVQEPLQNLLRLADKFDALVSPRSYKTGLPKSQTREILLAEGFDEKLIDRLTT